MSAKRKSIVIALNVRTYVHVWKRRENNKNIETMKPVSIYEQNKCQLFQ